MSNRQARREQSRTTRTTQRSRASRPTGRGSRPSPSRGGGSSIFSSGFLLALGAIAIVLVVVAVVFTQFFGGDSEDDELVQNLEAAEAALPLDMANGNTLGSNDAPVKITEYEDTQCPFCLRYTANVEPGLMEEFVKTGQVQITYKHLPLLGVDSVQGAMALTCAADQDKFWPFHNKLFTVQAEAGQSTNEQTNVGRFSESNLKGFATELGLDRTAFDACYASPDTIAEVTAQQQEAQSFGITSTPGFIVNGQQIGSGSPTIEGWRDIIQQVVDAGQRPQRRPARGDHLPSPSTSVTPSATATPSN
jgi:protein-disulfide isomerase